MLGESIQDNQLENPPALKTIKDTGTYTIADDSTVKIKMSYWDTEIVYNYSITGDKLVMDSDEPLRPSYDLTKTK